MSRTSAIWGPPALNGAKKRSLCPRACGGVSCHIFGVSAGMVAFSISMNARICGFTNVPGDASSAACDTSLAGRISSARRFLGACRRRSVSLYETLQLQLADVVSMDLVRAVGEAQSAGVRVGIGQSEVVGHAPAAVRLDGPVEHLASHARRRHLDHADLFPRRVVPHRV